MNLLLIRHGEVQYPLDDQGQKLVYDGTVPLSSNGVLQLESLGRLLAKEGTVIDALFVSPYLRAQQSADAVLKGISIPHRYEVQGLRDVDPNSWIGFPLADYAQIGGDTYSNPKPGREHEPLEQVALQAHRALREMYDIAAQEGFGTIAAVSHGDRLSALIWMLTHDMPPETYAEMKAHHYPNKGAAIGFTLDSSLRAIDKGREYRVPEISLGREWNK